MKRIFSAAVLGTIVALGLGLLGWPAEAAQRSGSHGRVGVSYGLHGGYRPYGHHGGGHHYGHDFGWNDHFWLGFTLPLGFSYTYNDYPAYDYYPSRRVYESPRVNYRPRRRAAVAHRTAPPTASRYVPPPKSPEELMLEHARAKRSNPAATPEK